MATGTSRIALPSRTNIESAAAAYGIFAYSRFNVIRVTLIM
jgi:hypothetical protein